jgi:hypothetical protein
MLVDMLLYCSQCALYSLFLMYFNLNAWLIMFH